MTRVAALLRAVNVGGHRIAMADLRAALTAEGFGEVETYRQSGNVVLSDGPHLATRIERTIADAFAMEAKVIVRSHAELTEISDSNPFPDADPKLLHVIFLTGAPSTGVAIDPPDEVAFEGRQAYVHYPDGSARSKATLGWFERRLGVTGTARNWNTVLALREMTATR